MRTRKEVQAVIFDKTTKNILLIRMLDLMDWKYHWRLVKGGIENGETPEQALRREISEEVGLKNILIKGKNHSYSFVFKDIEHDVSSYIVEASSSEAIKLGIDGARPIIEFIWTEKEKAIDMLHWENEKDAIRKACM